MITKKVQVEAVADEILQLMKSEAEKTQKDELHDSICVIGTHDYGNPEYDFCVFDLSALRGFIKSSLEKEYNFDDDGITECMNALFENMKVYPTNIFGLTKTDRTGTYCGKFDSVGIFVKKLKK